MISLSLRALLYDSGMRLTLIPKPRESASFSVMPIWPIAGIVKMALGNTLKSNFQIFPQPQLIPPPRAPENLDGAHQHLFRYSTARQTGSSEAIFLHNRNFGA